MKAKKTDFTYNAMQTPILLREYGRNIQNLIHYAKEIKDRDKRNAAVTEIVRLMKHFNPELKDKEDHIRKLWDYLFIVTDFKIDIDSPFPIPQKELLNSKPERVSYGNHRFSYRHYGRTVELMIKKAVEMDDSPMKKKLTHYIGCLMKMFYKMWNKDSVSDETIAAHLSELSKNKLKLDITKNNLDILYDAKGGFKPDDKKQKSNPANFRQFTNNNYQNKKNFYHGKNDNQNRNRRNQSRRNFHRSSDNFSKNR